MSYSLLKHQQELVDKLGRPEIPARLIGDEMLVGWQGERGLRHGDCERSVREV